MQNTRKTAIRVGLMVILSSLIFVGALMFIARWQFGAEGFLINVRFSFLNNLAVGAPVRVAGGINVGHVKDIYQKDLHTYVRIYLNDSLKNKIPKNSETQFAIYTQGLMGQKYINLQIGEPKEGDEFYQNKEEAIGIDPPSIDQMLMAFSSWFDGKNGGQVIAQIVHETKLFIESLNSIVSENRKDIRLTISNTRKSITSLSKQLDILVGRLNVLSSNFADISTKNKQDIEIMLTNMSLISKDLNLISKRITSGRGSIGKFINDDELYENTYETVRNARELFDTLKKEPWRFLYPR